jgi:dTDP-4-dehydrorhamnose reductase
MVASIKEMNWGITGASGQLSKSLVELLNLREVPYMAWDKSVLDITDKSSISVIAEASPDVLINCAAWTNVDGAEEDLEAAVKVNRDGARIAAIAAKELNIPLVHISTDYVFSGNSESPWKIEDETHPISNYGLSKLLGEKSIEETWPEKSIILRTAWLYGSHGKNFAKTVIRKGLANKNEIRVVHDQKGQPTTTNDLALQILACVEKMIPSGTYHATNSGEATWYEFACALIDMSGESSSRVIPVTSGEFQTKATRPMYSVLDHSTWSNVGVKGMRDWREALEEIYPEIHRAVESEMSHG